MLEAKIKKLTTRDFEIKDHALVCEWWEAQNWPKMPLETLSTTGVIVEIDGTPICAGWLYGTDSSIGWIEWIVADPNSSKTHKNLALDELIDELVSRAQINKYNVLFTSVNHPKLQKRLERHGFGVQDVNFTNLVRRLD